MFMISLSLFFLNFKFELSRERYITITEQVKHEENIYLFIDEQNEENKKKFSLWDMLGNNVS